MPKRLQTRRHNASRGEDAIPSFPRLGSATKKGIAVETISRPSRLLFHPIPKIRSVHDLRDWLRHEERLVPRVNPLTLAEWPEYATDRLWKLIHDGWKWLPEITGRYSILPSKPKSLHEADQELHYLFMAVDQAEIASSGGIESISDAELEERERRLGLTPPRFILPTAKDPVQPAGFLQLTVSGKTVTRVGCHAAISFEGFPAGWPIFLALLTAGESEICPKLLRKEHPDYPECSTEAVRKVIERINEELFPLGVRVSDGNRSRKIRRLEPRSVT